MEAGAPDTEVPRRGGTANELPSGAELRDRFAGAPGEARFTLGVEEEVMVLDPETLDLAPHAPALLERLGPTGPYKLELPASQLEITVPVVDSPGELVAPLRDARRAAAAAAPELAVLAAAAVHPFAAPGGVLNDFPRYRHTREEYGPVAQRQLVCALHVHVAIRNAGSALPVHNAARSFLPLIAALAANGAVYDGRDSGLASVRPKLCELLPRQGVPPPMGSWDELAAIYQWGERTGRFVAPRTWWWELRPHPLYGTLEFRVPDAQSTVADAVAIAGVVQALVAWLAARHEAGERLPVAETWRIEENRWSACRHGLAGTVADLAGDRARATDEALGELFDALAPVAAGLGGAAAIEHARSMLQAGGGPARQREAYSEAGARGVAQRLADCFLAG